MGPAPNAQVISNKTTVIDLIGEAMKKNASDSIRGLGNNLKRSFTVLDQNASNADELLQSNLEEQSQTDSRKMSEPKTKRQKTNTEIDDHLEN